MSVTVKIHHRVNGDGPSDGQIGFHIPSPFPCPSQLRSIHTMRFCLQFDANANAKNGWVLYPFSASRQHLHRHYVTIWCKRTCTRKRNVHFDASVNEALKFTTVWMVMDHLMDRLGSEPILSIKQSVSISTMVNFDGDGHGNGDGMCKRAVNGMCKRAFKDCLHIPSPSPSQPPLNVHWRTECVLNPFCPSNSASVDGDFDWHELGNGTCGRALNYMAIG